MTRSPLTGNRDRASRRRRRRALILPLVAAIILIFSAACGSSDDDTSAPESEVTATDSDDDEPDEEADEGDDADTGDLESIAGCPLGSWTLDTGGLRDWYAQFSAGTEGVEVTDVSGSAAVTFTPEAIVYEASDVSVTFDLTVQTMTSMLDGTVSHTWIDSGDGAISSEIDSNDMAASVTTGDGTEMDGAEFLDIEGLTSFSRYTCHDGSITLEQEAGPVVVTSTWQEAPAR